MITMTPGVPTRSQELAQIAYLRTYAYASAVLLLRKYQIKFTDSKEDAMKALAVNIVIEMLTKSGERQALEGSQIWQAALDVAGGGEQDSKDT